MNTNETHSAAFAAWRAARRIECENKRAALQHRLATLAPVALGQLALAAPVCSDDELPRASAPIAVVQLGEVSALLWQCEREAAALSTTGTAFAFYCADVLHADASELQADAG